MRYQAALLLLLFITSLSVPTAHAESQPPEGRDLWLYYPTNLLVPENVEKAREVWTRAAKAGYRYVLLADSKLSHLANVPGSYAKNVERAKRIAADRHLVLIPAVFDIGYSNSLLNNDPNLAEGLPVRDTPMVVHEGRAVIDAEPLNLRKPQYHDDNLQVVGRTATFQGGTGNSRLSFKLSLPKYRCYHVSVKIKTQDFPAEPQIEVLAGERGLQWQKLGAKRTQDWSGHDVVFDTLDNSDVNLYFGVWGLPPGAAAGSLAWKDWNVEEIALVNVLRRTGTPVRVTTDSGKELIEGTDFEPIVDPHMGNDPWHGEYRCWHKPPVIKLIGDKLPDGSKLRVSWHYPPIVYDGQVAACIGEPEVNSLLKDQAKRVMGLFDAPGYMMSHDEFRVSGWDESCAMHHETPGNLLSENVHMCRDLLRPKSAYVWSDMFDPAHNAVAGPYYLVNGPWTGSWEGLDKDVTIVNWNFGKRDASLKFFADRGNKQVIAGYYDGGQGAEQWLVSADKVTGVTGIMYTTWQQDFGHIEEFAEVCRRHRRH